MLPRVLGRPGGNVDDAARRVVPPGDIWRFDHRGLLYLVDRKKDETQPDGAAQWRAKGPTCVGLGN